MAAIVMELFELKNLCMEMAELGAANFIKKTAPGKDLLTQRQAYVLYNESRVKRWVSIGLVVPVRDGSAKNSPKRYSRAELMAANESEKINYIINK